MARAWTWGGLRSIQHPIAAAGDSGYHLRMPPVMNYLIPFWRPFRTLESDNEAASASACCSFSFATLEVASCHPGTANFALTEQRQPDAWRWAICSPWGSILRAGCEPTQTGAKRVAEEALQLEAA